MRVKHLSVWCLVIALVLPGASSAFASAFPDVNDSAYYYDAVADLVGRDIISGYPDGSFKPDDPVTRAQLAVMLVNANGIRTASKRSNFSDVPRSHWAYGFVSAAASEGYLTGYPDGSFRPDNNVSYNEALTMIVASLGYTMADLTGTYPTCFTDKAEEIGLLNTCGKIGDGAASRAEVACFISDSFKAGSGESQEGDLGPKDDTIYSLLGKSTSDVKARYGEAYEYVGLSSGFDCMYYPSMESVLFAFSPDESDDPESCSGTVTMVIGNGDYEFGYGINASMSYKDLQARMKQADVNVPKPTPYDFEDTGYYASSFTYQINGSSYCFTYFWEDTNDRSVEMRVERTGH